MGTNAEIGSSTIVELDNPAGTDGFAFVEFSHPTPELLEILFIQMGFTLVARHKRRDIRLFRQGEVDYLLNAEPESVGGRFCREHGPSAPSMGWFVADAERALAHVLAQGAERYDGQDGPGVIDAPAVRGIGGSLLYLVERPGAGASPYDAEYDWVGARDPRPADNGIRYLDHLTNNVHRGNMDRWYRFYASLFNFRQIRYFDIEGKLTGLVSRALVSPCGKIRIPINESADDKSQIEEYLTAYKGEGIQHIACGCDDIYLTVERLAARGLAFMPAPPDAYYEAIEQRLPQHGQPLDRLRRSGILIDGEVVADGRPRLLLQIFSQTVIGPIFFEFIERRGDDGFGEGNFRALFESIEADQLARGVLQSAE